MFALGGALAVSGQISLGVFIAFTSYVAALVGPARLVAGLVVTGQLARAGVERVYELIDSQPEIVDAPAAREVPAGPLGVELDDVRFGYARSEPVLDGLTLEITPGETVALVGTAGSGKSTVALLAPRFYDVQGGALRIGPPGEAVDVRELRLDALRRAVGVVFEEAFLFSDTVRRQHRLRLPRRHRRAGPRRRRRRAGRRVHQRPARRLRHPRRRARA